jgi:hypothetical protein
MNYPPSILPLFRKKISRKFLLIFSFFILSVTGVVWACSDGDFDASEYSSFSPEPFVASQYSPFFYHSSSNYYYSSGGDYYNNTNDNSDTRYNELVTEDWNNYLNNKIDLKPLLFNSSLHGIDSVYSYFKGKTKVLPKGMPNVRSSSFEQKKTDSFLAYLRLAKECETFANQQSDNWDNTEAKNPTIPAHVGTDLLKAFNTAPDIFIKERLWFQLVRYYYFKERSHQSGAKNEILTFFEGNKEQFPENMMYYRTLGYIAGHYYNQKDYATANYLYSLAYNFSAEMKIPSNWSFHPQNESDWQRSLQMAQNDNERITLWQMLGINSDPTRAIDKIYVINPKSEKLDLLLSILVNMSEVTYRADTAKWKSMKSNVELVSNIARKNNTDKPYFWNLAAGYMNTLSGNYTTSKTFYNKAKTQLPKNDKLLAAQYKILDWTLYISQLKKIDAKTEGEMTEPINWLADLRDGKDSVKNLRFKEAVARSIRTLSALYLKQGNQLKANCFDSKTSFYTSNQNIESLKALMTKPEKTPFEMAMLRYYHLTIEDLEYHQALMLVYKEKINEAVPLMEKSGKNASFTLLGNPFTIHIRDCHDCDFAAPQKKTYTPLSFVKTIQTIKSEIAGGKNLYTNAYLLANAYYNITYYGNARTFYQTTIINAESYTALDLPAEFRQTFTSGKLAEKYYLLARANATSAEQKARCTYMASKCERNEIYNGWYKDNHKMLADERGDFGEIPKGKYFAELKSQYGKTQYYKEVLQECGYFRKYANK